MSRIELKSLNGVHPAQLEVLIEGHETGWYVIGITDGTWRVGFAFQQDVRYVAESYPTRGDAQQNAIHYAWDEYEGRSPVDLRDFLAAQGIAESMADQWAIAATRAHVEESKP
jgi:hypothetical protein